MPGVQLHWREMVRKMLVGMGAAMLRLEGGGASLQVLSSVLTRVRVATSRKKMMATIVAVRTRAPLQRKWLRGGYLEWRCAEGPSQHVQEGPEREEC